MKNVLLVIVPGYEAPNAVAYAIDRARNLGGELIALAVVDPSTHQRVATALSDVGFVGERVSEDVMEALEKEQRGFADLQLAQVRAEAERAGVPVSVRIEAGDPGEVTPRICTRHQVALVVLVAEKRSWVTRFLSRSTPVKLPALASCEVKVMED
jgi:nucleotide-binding universal stress UspA family protein